MFYNFRNWGKWSEEKNKYDAMIFEKGQSCWNGPDRSVKVIYFHLHQLFVGTPQNGLWVTQQGLFILG